VLALPLEAVAPLTQMRALEASGGIAYWRGQLDPARDYYTRALAIAEAHADDAEQANATYNLSFVYGIPPTDGSPSELGQALALARIARGRWSTAGDRAGVGRASWALATFLHIGVPGQVERTKLDEALATAQEALSIHRGTTNRFDVSWDLHLLGMIYLKLGRLDDAARTFSEAASLFSADGDLSGLAVIASNTAVLAGVRGQAERQAVLVGFADALAKRSGTGLLANLRIQDGRPLPQDLPSELQPAVERGRAMDIRSGIEYAIEESEVVS
jgi:tetratricopeptide (TPR) repeat protein